ncbi:glycoside hydrolase family 2 protein [Rhodohalobacter sp.]|uniref:glycoside hydrolase family 2 protein n=1 Tax=Rhodohalobacter sp. TaxID=1974210 RepID=UPI002ACEF9FC|nr:glycoside hydrolase family 2 TIM barrel-domain containing protein [Rhodohalobacter sp.]MDZ7758004.1 glycoside hydrolase family 2 TIM barrel-domain containing protein [Rhodohalobacter sp.]
MRYLSLLLALLIVSIGCNQTPDKTEFQDPTTLNFNKEWEFVKDIDPEVTESLFDRNSSLEWESVSLPHTAHIEPLVISDQQWQGDAFYRKFFELKPEDKDKHIALRFHGAMHEADVWLNGEMIRKHKGGYLPFVVDITDKVNFEGENTLLVKLNNENNPTIPPGKPIETLDFNWFSGLYRNVDLLVDPKIHISDPIAADRVSAGGVLVNFTDVSDESATVNIQTDVENFDVTDGTVSVKTVLKDSTGRVISEQISDPENIEPNSYHLFDQQIEVDQPELWSPDSPYLYTLTVELLQDGEAIDFWQKRIGIRTISFNEDHQFVLNGEPLQLRGTNRHQSYPYIGYALSENAQFRDAYKIKDAGFNFIRTAHYPPSTAFLEAADELGLLFMNAIPGWQFFGDEEFQELAFRDIREMIRRDRNHPSIVIWEASLNESDMPESFMEQAHEIVHEELPFENTYTSGWIDHAYDIFIPARQHASPPEYWASYPKEKPLFIAEYGDWEYYAHNAGFNQDAYEDLQEEERTSRQLRGDGQVRLAQQALNFQEAHNSNLQGWAFGDANWVMYDYNRGYDVDLEASGIRDIFRLPKFANYFYKSQGGPNLDSEAEFNKPMIYIANFWSDPDFKTVKVYSNTDEVELYLNDELIERRSPDSDRVSTHLNHPPFTFELDEFEPGRLKAVGYLDGEVVVETERITPGEARAVQLSIDKSGREPESGQNDVLFVYASILDENGTVVPDANPEVFFEVEGDAELIGYNPIEAEAGIATILLKVGESHGEITLRALSDGLRSDEYQILVK